MKKRNIVKTVMLVLAVICITVFNNSAANAEEFSVAVFTFESKDRVIADLGTKITDLLTMELSLHPEINLVERETLNQAFEEMGLGLTGIVNENDAIKIGHLTGAKLLITGRAFTVDRNLYITAKIISTETSKVHPEVSKGKLSDDLVPIIEELSQKLAKAISEKGSAMVAKTEEEKDIINGILEKIKDKNLPKVLVFIQERHFGGRGDADPAAETEFSYILNECGFTIATRDEPGISDWAKEYLENTKTKIPPIIQEDVIVMGEAFSELGMAKGNLISVKARVEIKIIDRRTNEILAIDRQTNVAVDIAEHFAAKTAIAEATADIAARTIPEMVDKWNAAKDKESGKN